MGLNFNFHDILIEKDYFLFIERAFKSFPEMIGVNGVITNMPKSSIIKSFVFKLTHFGIFKDNRPKIIRSLIKRFFSIFFLKVILSL